MRLTLEKVLILKDVALFAGIPEAALSDIISASEETAAMIGTDIVKQGELWNDLYIILQGQVRLHKDGKTIKEYNALDVFGELAALDAAPSEITVTALEDTTLYKKKKKNFLSKSPYETLKTLLLPVKGLLFS